MKIRTEPDADEAGDPGCSQRVLAERRRHGLHGLRLQLDRQRTTVEHAGEVAASDSLKLPVICTLPVNEGCCTVGAEITSPSSSMASWRVGQVVVAL